ncbi:MAG: aminoacyl-tRNA hydrolase [Winkia sp. UMB750A]|uniref:aminoacyl-tRNA hydrolase n=1 Tax=unclassified Winkia TaxID=2692119 RepID=UPI00255234B5|nr:MULTISPECIES: aminoacyl-tRNA hydrolase [unclassified Winkia]MDK8224861.1 aminoacyl-tRNA hydrolase [Winkia sp. UMB750B]MDK8257186.1 aminoacyl-tRNA hydrolase [Winkia sp. UMB750A]
MTWLVVGLGNPGQKYERTRHSVGHMVINAAAEKFGGTLKKHRAGAFLAEPRVGTMPGGAPGPKTMLATVTCFMNVSGGPVAQLCKYYDVPADKLLVVHDDLDLPDGQLRLKVGGGEGGHNGLRSISKSLGTKHYARLRVGIGRPQGRQDPADYVLAPVAGKALTELEVTVARAVDVIEDIVTTDFLGAQMRLHSNG